MVSYLLKWMLVCRDLNVDFDKTDISKQLFLNSGKEMGIYSILDGCLYNRQLMVNNFKKIK